MKKSERINQELFFFNEYKEFNLADLMNTFNISKSTALRDIEELERLGVPLYVDSGRYGGHKILNNSLLPPIYFNEKEVFAIFFSLQLLKSIIDSPFEHSYEQIREKLLQTFDDKKQQQITQAMESARYEGITQIVAADNLETLFSSILKKQIVTFNYTRYENVKKNILPIRLVIIDGFWYCSGLDLDKNAWRTYRCEFIEILEIAKNNTIKLTNEEIQTSLLAQQESYRDIDFKVKTTSLGKEYFLKHQFSNMQLTETASAIYIVGKINKSEINFLANYLLGFGEQIQILEPNGLKKEYLSLLERMFTKNKGN